VDDSRIIDSTARLHANNAANLEVPELSAFMTFTLYLLHHEIRSHSRYFHRPPYRLSGNGEAIISHQGNTHRETNRHAQARRVLVASGNLSRGTSHDPG
jgi:hypothetical protein